VGFQEKRRRHAGFPQPYHQHAFVLEVHRVCSPRRHGVTEKTQAFAFLCDSVSPW
jgi:hypothetical protein